MNAMVGILLHGVVAAAASVLPTISKRLLPARVRVPAEGAPTMGWSRNGVVRHSAGSPARLARVAATLAALCLAALPTHARAAEMLVGNEVALHPPGNGHEIWNARPRGQNFVTGAACNGYKLNSVHVNLNAGVSGNGTVRLTVRANETTANGPSRGNPAASALYTLTGPASIVRGLNKFAAPFGARLDPDTRYWIVMEYSGAVSTGGPRWADRIASRALEPGNDSDWSIPAGILARMYWNWGWVSSHRSQQIRVYGSAVPGTCPGDNPPVNDPVDDPPADPPADDPPSDDPPRLAGMPQPWLVRFGRTVAEKAIEVVEGRFSTLRAPGIEMTLAGQRIGAGARPRGPDAPGTGAARATAPYRGTGLEAEKVEFRYRDPGQPAEEAEARSRPVATAGWLQGADTAAGAMGRRAGFRSYSVTPRDLLTGSSFALTGETETGGLVTLWGRGAVSHFDGRDGDLQVDGDVTGVLLGADWTRGPGSRLAGRDEPQSGPEAEAGAWTLGLLVSRTVGEGGFRGPAADATQGVLTGRNPPWTPGGRRGRGNARQYASLRALDAQRSHDGLGRGWIRCGHAEAHAEARPGLRTG